MEVVELIAGDGTKSYSPGIIMEHLGDTTVDAAIREEKLSEIEYTRVHEANLRMSLEELKLVHGDMHRCNVMYFKGRCYIIDMGPQAIRKK